MLTSTSKYALRVLVVLAGADRTELIPGSVLASTTSIPSNYLSKILADLGNAGLVSARRGTGGGYRLERPADAIPLIEPVEVFEGVRTRPSCLLGIHEICSDERPCSAHACFRDIRARYIAFLEDTTIAEVAAREPQLELPRST